ncbi:Hybrid signal transduction histidine kinase [Heracleum sosnowskyi]|uniref:Hybrid signal transduction histidine kinase n=1 Tax=Heracleum sosnowskyi TaxID=360622 RepID=A0AAD8JA24_9APIA|nr:Hybrid signal transduction histidine kinase [Heracleum sosnowskyi]
MLRRSFGSGDGAGNKGGGMLRSVQSVVRVGGGGATQETLSRPTSPPGNTTPPRPTSNLYKPNSLNTLSVSNSTTAPPFCNPFHSPTSTWASASDSSEFGEWEYVDSIDENDKGLYCDENLVFGPVPSVDEVQHAVSSIQQFQHVIKDNPANDLERNLASQVNSPTGFLHRVPSYGSEVDWMEPSLSLCNASLLKPFGSDRLYDAFHLLQTEPHVQKMVISLSSDKAVWDAVLNNEVVRELKQSLAEAKSNVSLSSLSSEGDESDDSETSVDILSWIFVNMKTKILDLVDKITNMMDGLFLHPRSANKTEQVVDSFDEKLKTSFLLSVVVFLIVVVGRASRA